MFGSDWRGITFKNGVFNVLFLAIHSFKDEDVKFSRILSNLMLLRARYSRAFYFLSKVKHEHNKQAFCESQKKNRLERFNDEDSFFADFEFGCAECRRVQKVIHVEGETVAGGFFPDAVFFRIVEFEELVSGCSSQIDEGDILDEI